MKHIFSILLYILLPVCFLSCTNEDNDVDWSEDRIIEISSEIVAINTFGEPSVVNGMKIRIQGENDWKVYPTTFIDGFIFESGYFYTLKVKITHLNNPPLDAYDVQYELISLISKTKKSNSKV